MKQRVVVSVASLVLACVMLPVVASAADDLAAQKADAERRQDMLHDEQQQLQKTMAASKNDRDQAADALRQSESAISDIDRRLNTLASQTREAQADLQSLQGQIQVQNRKLQAQRDLLVAQLQAQYRSKLSPWVALLSGDDPQQLGRQLAYLGYVSGERAKLVRSLHEDVDHLQGLQALADARQKEIAQNTAEAAQQRDALQQEQRARATVVAQLEGKIAAQRSQAAQLGQDEQRMTTLIDGLQTAIAKQEALRRAQEAERKRQEAERQRKQAEQAQAQREAAERARQAAARQKAEAAAQAQREADASRRASQIVNQAAQSVPSTPAAPPVGAPTLAQAPAPAPSQPEASSQAPAEQPPTRDQDVAPELGSAGNGLTPGLPMPVRGALEGRFGLSRPDGGVWRGIVITAPAGTPVRAVAGGTVVFANWLRGFGNLMIVDHGHQYMTIYGYNQSLLKRVGDHVRAGEQIASVGATGGQVESGLYFEIRHNGIPVDPAKWLTH